MQRLKILAVTVLLLAGAVSAQARLVGNGPEQSGAMQVRIVGILSIDLGGTMAR